MILIISLIIIQAGYDYLGWNTILHENPKYKWQEYLYRIIKFILDYPATIILVRSKDLASLNTLEIFYILKQFGWCDAIYISIWKIFHWHENYTSEGIWWLWWTCPLGWLRTIRILFLSGAYKEIMKNQYGNNWWKGRMNLKEFTYQLIAAIIIVILLTLLKLI